MEIMVADVVSQLAMDHRPFYNILVMLSPRIAQTFQ